MDEDLVAALNDGARWAGPALVSVHTPPMEGYAAKIAPDLSQVEREIAVDKALNRAIANIHTFNPERGALGAWLRGCVRNAISDARAAKRTVDPLDENIPEPFIEPDGDPRRVHEIEFELLKLSEQDQLIIGLRDYDQLTYDQIADVIGGVTAGACRVRHHRAIARLRGLLDENPVFAKYTEGSPTT